MMVLQVFLFIIEGLTSAMLIGVIFLQKSKGAGMGTAFGGAGEAIFGSRMGNVLTKTTVVLAAVFLVNTTFLAWLGARQQPSSVMERASIPAPTPVPGGMPGGGMMPGEMPAPVPGGEAIPMDDMPMGDMPMGDAPIDQPTDATGAALPEPIEPADVAVPPVVLPPVDVSTDAGSADAAGGDAEAPTDD